MSEEDASQRTFDHDVDGVVHWAELIPGHAPVTSCVRLWNVVNAKGPLVVQERRALGWQIAAHFGPRDFRGWPRINRERDDDTRAGGHLSRSLWDWRKGKFFHLQSFSNALHLQHLSPQHYGGAGGPRWDEEWRLPLVYWSFYIDIRVHKESYYQPLRIMSP